MFMILSMRMLVNLATLFRFLGMLSVEPDMTNPPCWYRAWRTIPTSNSSMLWFRTTDVSTYLHLYLSASFLASVTIKTKIQLFHRKSVFNHNSQRLVNNNKETSIALLIRKKVPLVYLFLKRLLFGQGPLCWPLGILGYRTEGPAEWPGVSWKRFCMRLCRWPRRRPELCQLLSVVLEAVREWKTSI